MSNELPVVAVGQTIADGLAQQINAAMAELAAWRMAHKGEPSRCERTALCSSCGAALSCQDCGDKHSTCSDAQCDIHRPCSCGEADCHWSGAGEVIHALGWHDAPKPKLSKPTGTGERLSKPWTAPQAEVTP